MTAPETFVGDFIRYIKQLQAHVGHESHSFKLAKALQVRVRVGRVNRAIPEAVPSPVIMVQPWWYGTNNDVIRHELAHVMLWWSQLEDAILTEYGPETGWQVIENLCNQATAFLQITQPMVDDAVRKHRVTAQAVRHLQKLSGADASTALRRLIYDDPVAERAGFITSGKYIVEVAQCNHGLPFWRLQRVPEPRIVLPDASLIRLPGGGGLIGVVGT